MKILILDLTYKGMDFKVYSDGQIFSVSAGKFLSQHNRGGYRMVRPYRKSDKTYHHTGVHRLVALAFHPNPEEKEYVNHIDGDKTNNSANNLEWATPSENNQHAYDTGLRTQRSLWKPAVGRKGNLTVRLKNLSEGKLLGLSPSHIGHCLKGTRKTHAGFTWRKPKCEY